jgi:hypothetical protein
VKITQVKSNHALGEELERLPMEEDADDEPTETDDDSPTRGRDRPDRPERLGSRDNFWGGS